MDLYSGYINKLIDELSGLPGIGSKSAQRLAFHIINLPAAKVERLARTMTDAKEHVRYCEECFTLTDSEKCPVCANDRRDHSVIMVVETPEIWPLMKKPANTRAYIMSFTEPFPPCWGSAPMISS